MTLAGALAAGLALGLVVIATRGPSRVQRRLDAIGERRGRGARIRTVLGDDVTARLAGALLGALAGSVVSTLLSLGPLPVVVAAYAGYLAPALAAERAQAARRRDADRAVVTLVEWLHALVACGRPVEAAITCIARRRSGSDPLDASLSRVLNDYTLGVPMHRALAREGERSESRGIVRLADQLERARDLGRGALPLIADLRDELRSAERAGALERASHVEGKLTLVLTLCYLPALALLVIIPLFLTLLAGLFG